jgi:predicted AAA+ superfamily ATPase
MHEVTLPAISLDELINEHDRLARKINQQMKPLPLFKDYLRNGYLPIVHNDTPGNYLARMANIINTVLEYDISFIEGYTSTNLVKVKKLLGIIAESVPYEPNISELARKMKLGRDTVNTYLRHLQKGRIVNLIQKQSKGMAALQKPDKIYLENPNFNYALKHTPNVGAVREGFLLNQLTNAGYKVALPPRGDFYVSGEDLTIEVGGQNKDAAQIKNVPNSVIAADDIETGFARKIPLWLFGFLY